MIELEIGQKLRAALDIAMSDSARPAAPLVQRETIMQPEVDGRRGGFSTMRGLALREAGWQSIESLNVLPKYNTLRLF